MAAVPIFCPATRYRRKRSPCGSVDDAPVHRGNHCAAAGTQSRHAELAVQRLPGGAACSLILIAALSWGAGRINRREPPRAEAELKRRTAQADGTVTSILADHSLLLALPAFAPAFVVAGVVAWVAIRDRRKGDELDDERSTQAKTVRVRSTTIFANTDRPVCHRVLASRAVMGHQGGPVASTVNQQREHHRHRRTGRHRCHHLGRAGDAHQQLRAAVNGRSSSASTVTPPTNCTCIPARNTPSP